MAGEVGSRASHGRGAVEEAALRTRRDSSDGNVGAVTRGGNKPALAGKEERGAKSGEEFHGVEQRELLGDSMSIVSISAVDGPRSTPAYTHNRTRLVRSSRSVDGLEYQHTRR